MLEAQQNHHTTASWKIDLQTVTDIVEAEVRRANDGEEVSCIQLHIAGGQTLGVQYINYSCVYILQVCPFLLLRSASHDWLSCSPVCWCQLLLQLSFAAWHLGAT